MIRVVIAAVKTNSKQSLVIFLSAYLVECKAIHTSNMMLIEIHCNFQSQAIHQLMTKQSDGI